MGKSKSVHFVKDKEKKKYNDQRSSLCCGKKTAKV